MTKTSSRPRTTVLAAVVASALAVVLLVPAPVIAGDNAAIFYFEPDEIDAEAGDTVTVDLVVSTHGGYTGDGIDTLSATIEYDPDVLTVTAVEHGPMLAEGAANASVNGTADVDDESGTVTLNQERTPSGEGAKATETAATLTVEIADDAPSTTETLEITESETLLVSGYPQGVVERDASIVVGDGDSGEADSEGAQESFDGEDDSVPGFALVGTGVGVAVALAVAVFVRRSR